MKGGGNIYLVGMMGAGKTTAGKLLARRLKLDFLDSDQEIERRCGVTVPVIFEIEGEPGFRKREAEEIHYGRLPFCKSSRLHFLAEYGYAGDILAASLRPCLEIPVCAADHAARILVAVAALLKP